MKRKEAPHSGEHYVLTRMNHFFLCRFLRNLFFRLCVDIL